jgi:hypothetical protein
LKIYYTSRKTLRTILVSIVVITILAVIINYVLVNSQLSNRGPDYAGWDEELVRLSDELPCYTLDVSFHEQEKLVRAALQLDYTNNTGTGLGELYFILHPNAFSSRGDVPFPDDQLDQAYPEGFSEGYIDILKVESDYGIAHEIEGERGEFLRVDLYTPLKAGDSIVLNMEFEVKLPNSLGRFGYGEYTYNITNWYPILAVYDREVGWSLYPYYDIGDPFYSDVANYKVTITVPKDYEVACTGVVNGITEYDDVNSWHIEAMVVRDFAWILSDEFMVSEERVDDTLVKSYYYSRHSGTKALEYGRDAIEIFNEYFGDYPYPQFSIVQADFYIGGMEYPNLVLNDKSLYNTGSQFMLEYVTVHETAHQWWYGLVGSDQVMESWLDEGLTEYSTVIYFEEKYGRERGQAIYEGLVEGKYQSYKNRLNALDQEQDDTILKPTYQFEDWMAYDALVYGKGAMVFHNLRREMGDDTFKEVLTRYYNEMRFKNATTQDLIDICNKVTNRDWKDFFEDWLFDEFPSDE